MRKIFDKPIAEHSDLESRYFQMEVQTAVASVTRQHSSKGSQFLLALSAALRDQAGRELYKNKGTSDKNINEGGIWS